MSLKTTATTLDVTPDLVDQALLVKVTAELPDVFIAIRESEKIGFDSDKAEANFKGKKSDIKASLQALIGPLQELLKDVD